MVNHKPEHRRFNYQRQYAPSPKRRRWILLIIPLALISAFFAARTRTITQAGQAVIELLPITGIGNNNKQMEAMRATVQSIVAANPDLDISVAVKDLKFGTQAAVGTDKPFIAASTTKVLTAAAFLHDVEKGQDKLTDTYNGYPASWHLQQMINQSNNESWAVLNEAIGPAHLEDYAKSIGLDSYNYTNNVISATDSSVLLGKLYSQQLLTKEHTRLLLGYMQDTNNEDMIPAALGESMTTYHKYGQLDENLHDIGIVLQDKHAVVIAVYTAGKDGSDYNDRTAVIKQIVRAVTDNLYTK